MARPSKRRLACRNANEIKKRKAKERRETGGLALGSSQARDTDTDTGNAPTPNDGNEEIEKSEDNRKGAVREVEEVGENETERQLRESLSGVTASAPALASPQSTSAVPLATCPDARYSVPQPATQPFQYHPITGPSYSDPSSSSSSSFFLGGSSSTSPQYMGPQSNPALPPLHSFLPPPPHQTYTTQAPPLPNGALPPNTSPATPAGTVPEVSNYNYISGKPVCRQTLWRRKKRAEAAALNAVPAPPEPDPVRLHREEIAEAIAKWPRVPTAKLKEDILDSAITDIEKLLKSKVRRPKGQDLNRHQQVLQFMNIQRMNRNNTPRMDLALVVANMYRKGREVADRIVRHEKEWIKRRVIPAGGQGKNAKVPSMLEDEGTRACIEAHIETMGEKLTAAGLAVAVSAYWQAQNGERFEEEVGEQEGDGESEGGETRKRKLTLSSRTASTWLGKLGYVFEDGVYRYKGVQPVIAPAQEGGAGGYV